ncbi:MAG: WD40 repeat domain-containing protein, partial [Moorea sp. SIO2I5]|nr:WD40 repeat domain-containing protein [Moorena sp. SIO2I5]
ALAVTGDGKYAVSGSDDYTLKVWDLKNRVEKYTLTAHNGEVGTLAITPDGKWAISGSADCTIKVWDLNMENPREKYTLTGHNREISAVALTTDGHLAISTSWDNNLKVWNLQEGKAIANFRGDSELFSCAIAPDGITIIAGEASGRLHFLRLESIA